MSFVEYVALLQRRWRIWTTMIVVGLLVALGFNFFSERQYSAVATSFVNVVETGTPGSSNIFQGSQFAVSRMASYAALSSSPDVLQPVISKLGLSYSPRELRQLVDVSSPADSVLLRVSAENPDPRRAAAIADEVSRQLGLVIEKLETPRGRNASPVKVTLIQPADVPVSPSSPRVWLNLLLGLVGGAALGLLVALLRHALDRRLKTADDIRAITHVAPLGSTVYNRAAKRDPLVAMNHRSLDAERYRTIRTALKFADVDHELHHFVISSPMPGEGKTSVASNLAISWAQTGARVCLVDAGLRRPMVSKIFGIDKEAGLSDVLVGDVELDDVLVPWNDGLLTVLPAGSLPPDPAALLGSASIAKLVSDLRTRFDIVIYDSDPLVAVPDAALLGRSLDGMVLVVRAGSTTRDQLSASLDTVREARVTLLGTVRFGARNQTGTNAYYSVSSDWRRTELTKPAADGRTAADRSAADQSTSGS